MPSLWISQKLTELAANLIAFFKELGVPTTSTEMTFGVSRDQGAFEWAGTNLSSIFAQKSNLLSLRFWRMIFDVVRFNHFALDVLRDADESENDPSGADRGSRKFPSRNQESIGEYLDRENYSDGFINDYLIPMTACVWSTSPDKCSLKFPAVTLIRFLWNHHLLNTISERAPWMTIKDGTKVYIEKALQGFPPENVHLGKGVQSLKAEGHGKIKLLFQDRDAKLFDHVVLATHGDQALDIMRGAATPAEQSILAEFKTSTNVAVLHNDLSLMPRLRHAWSAWNFMSTSSADWVASVCLTYCMNLLQHIPEATFGPVLVTLNPIHPPAPASVQGRWTYEHPLYTPEAIQAQARLPKIQNTRGISYAGAWTKYGFHEDGFSSGLKVAVEHLGAELPFEFVDSTFSRGRRPEYDLKTMLLRLVIQLIHVLILTFGFVEIWMRVLLQRRWKR